jgi:hypothetical protein
MAREYPLVIHCPVAVLIPKYAMTFGSAVVNAVARIEDAIPEITRFIKIKFLCLFDIFDFII